MTPDQFGWMYLGACIVFVPGFAIWIIRGIMRDRSERLDLRFEWLDRRITALEKAKRK